MLRTSGRKLKDANKTPVPSVASGGHIGRIMSNISGATRPLCHSNSLTSDKVPKYGVETGTEQELGKV